LADSALARAVRQGLPAAKVKAAAVSLLLAIGAGVPGSVLGNWATIILQHLQLGP